MTSPPPDVPTPQQTSFLAIILRAFWMMFGPMILVPLAYTIATSGGGWFSGYDIAFLVILLLLPLSRWLEFRTGHAKTAEGEPATLEHLRRYALLVAAIGVPCWLIANVVGWAVGSGQ